jgi:hypothetical protein
MLRISIPWLIDVVQSLDLIDGLHANQPIVNNIGALFPVLGNIEAMFTQSIYGPYLRASRDAGTALHTELARLTDANKDWDKTNINDYEVIYLKSLRDRFRTVLLGDLSVAPSFLVSAKDSYDTIILIEAGLKLFPPSLMAKAPEIEKDALEAGRALAFELPTACGFHTFRVTESVVRRYWDAVSNNKARPDPQTLGKFAAEMNDGKFGDAKVIEAIKQMTKLHRNPLIHPEVILTSEEAIGILGMARSVISAMLQVLPDVPGTTGAPAAPVPSTPNP